MSNTVPAVTPLDLDPSNLVTELQSLLAANSNALAVLISASLDTFMPVVDTTSAIVTALPTLAVNLDLAGFHQLAGGNLQAAFDNFTAPIGGSVGLSSIASFLIVSDIQDAAGGISSAVQSAVTDDIGFIEGLPGLFS